MTSSQSRIVIALLALLLVLNVATAIPWYRYHQEYRDAYLMSPLTELEDLFLKGEYSALLDAVDELESEFPKDPNVFFYRGMALYHLNQYQEAIHNFEMAISINPNFRDDSVLWIEVSNEELIKMDNQSNGPEALEGGSAEN